MPFVNEYIPELDFTKYNISKIDEDFVVGGTHARGWTIDRERDIYLRNVANGREEFRANSTWTFSWHGELLVMRIETLGAGGERGGHCWSHQKVHRLDLPSHLEVHRSQIIADLREALAVYKDGGVFATALSYDLLLDIE